MPSPPALRRVKSRVPARSSAVVLREPVPLKLRLRLSAFGAIVREFSEVTPLAETNELLTSRNWFAAGVLNPVKAVVVTALMPKVGS